MAARWNAGVRRTVLPSMQTTRWRPTALALAAAITTISTTGCLCGADEQHAVTFSSADSLTVTRDGVARKIGVVNRLTAPPVSPSSFEVVFNTVEGSTSGDGVVLTLSGNDPVSDELVILALALPVSLRSGEEYPVGATFTVDAGLDTDPRATGAYDLRQSNRAEVAFTVASYSFPPPQFTTHFRAATSTGTVRVTRRERGRIELSLDLRLVDAAGRASTVTGRAQATSERYTPPCT